MSWRALPHVTVVYYLESIMSMGLLVTCLPFFYLFMNYTCNVPLSPLLFRKDSREVFAILSVFFYGCLLTLGILPTMCRHQHLCYYEDVKHQQPSLAMLSLCSFIAYYGLMFYGINILLTHVRPITLPEPNNPLHVRDVTETTGLVQDVAHVIHDYGSSTDDERREYSTFVIIVD